MKKINQWKRNSRTASMICLLCTVILLTGGCQTKQTTQPIQEKSVVPYQTEYYKIEIPTGWNIESRNGSTLFSKEEKILSIEASDGNYYCNSAQQIIDIYLGMHASVKGELKEVEENGWQKAEAVIAWELSPGLSEQGEEAEPDEWHCIYRNSKGIIVDISMDDKWSDDPEIKNLLQSFQVFSLDKIY